MLVEVGAVVVEGEEGARESIRKRVARSSNSVLTGARCALVS